MLEQRLMPLFPETDCEPHKMGVEVVHFDAEDRPARRRILSMDLMLAPLSPEKASRSQARG